MTVARILAEKGDSVVTLPPHRTIDEAIHLLAEKRIGALVIGDAEGRVIGILSERDVMRALASEGASALDRPISHHMTTKVVTCTRRASIEDVMETMTEGRFRHLPVVEEGRLVGVVSIGDVVKRRIEDAEREAEEIKQYIATA